MNHFMAEASTGKTHTHTHTHNLSKDNKKK